MDFVTLFGIYYALYRGEGTPPETTDPEWLLAIRYYNDALQRLTKMDDTKWNFLYGTLQSAADGDKILATGTTQYDTPTDMSEPGGFITYIDASGNRLPGIPLVQPYETQALNSTSGYAYFTGDEQTGLTLNVNPAPTVSNNGYGIDYVYYKKATLLADDEDGSTLIVGADPAFLYNHMLASRYRISRNYPSYQIAKRDAEEALKGMKLKNNSGTHYSAWGVQDTSPGFGV